MTPQITSAIWGAVAMAAVVAGLIFLRAWRRVGDRIFVFFAAAFVTLSLSWLALAVLPFEAPARRYSYLVKLLAFILIIIGIIDKNRRERRP